MAQIVDLSFPAVPNFPNGGMTYEQRYQNELNNILRLYLERLTAQLQALSGEDGGFYLQFPHISASDSNDQLATASNTPTKILWNTEESISGFTLNTDSTATPDYLGIYKITYSLQLVNTDNVAHDVAVWLKLNGDDVPNSATIFTVPARKSAGVYSYVCAYSEATFSVTSTDKISLWWATGQAYSTSPSTDGVYIEALPAITSPYSRPAVPSVIGSITFVSGS